MRKERIPSTRDKINKNVSIGIMKSKIIQLFISTKTELQHILKQLKTKFIRYMEPVRKGRNYVRSFKVRALKSKFITVSNYARAF